MLSIPYPVDDVFLHAPLVQLARQDAEISVLHDVLEQVLSNPQIQLALRHDLSGRNRRALWQGCPSLPVAVTVCLAVVRRLMGWRYRVTAPEVNGRARWRWVCPLAEQPLPNFRTIQEREAKIKPQTLHLILAQVVALGQAAGLTTGQRLRVESPVIESNLHDPTVSSLLNDAARVLSRLIRDARGLLPPRKPEEKVWFRDRHRQARRLARQIGQAFRRARQKAANSREKSRRQAYMQLITVVSTLRDQVAWIQPRLARRTDLAAASVQALFQQYVPLVQQVIAPARQRILENVAVPARETLVSLFEPHTAIRRRGKAKPGDTEFGHKLWYAEVDGGLISEYRILEGNPPDAEQLPASLKAHQRQFDHAPRELSGDRGVASPANERTARAAGVKHVLTIR